MMSIDPDKEDTNLSNAGISIRMSEELKEAVQEVTETDNLSEAVRKACNFTVNNYDNVPKLLKSLKFTQELPQFVLVETARQILQKVGISLSRDTIIRRVKDEKEVISGHKTGNGKTSPYLVNLQSLLDFINNKKPRIEKVGDKE